MFEEGRTAAEVLRAFGPRVDKDIVVPEIPQAHIDRTCSEDAEAADIDETKSDADDHKANSSSK